MREAARVAKALPAETLDLVVLATGILAARQRQETAEGIERDMAVSYLSRLVILREIGPRLGRDRATGPTKPRVFIMGQPGTGQAGTLGDLNAERSYSAMAVHMNTIAGNEMLVLDAAKRYPNATFFGLAPGIIKTNIRENFFTSRVIEWMIGLMTPTPETYAERLVPVLVSADLEAHSGAMFNQKGLAILPSPKLLNHSYVEAFLAASEALVSRAKARVAANSWFVRRPQLRRAPARSGRAPARSRSAVPLGGRNARRPREINRDFGWVERNPG